MNDMNVSEMVENLDADQIKKLSSEDIEKLRQIFKLIFEAIEMFGRLKEQGAMEHVTMDVLNKGRDVLAQFLNVKVDYETAKAITRKSDTAFNSKVSRCGIPVYKERLYNFHDIVKIRDKKI